jgi:colanic acid/amylovoran biosynthesis glycosyltransferase
MKNKREITRKAVIFALGSYMPRTYTWVYNQLKFLKSTNVFILANMLHPDSQQFPLGKNELFFIPGFNVYKNDNIILRIIRKILWFVVVDTRIDLLIFAWQAKKRGCSLIHAHFANIGWKYIPVARMLNIPLVVAFYGYDYDQLPNLKPIWEHRYIRLFKYCNLFLTEGEFGRKRLIERGASSDQVLVHHLGIDIDALPFSIRRLEQDDVLRLVQVANIVEKKGHRSLIEAMRILKEKGSIDRTLVTIIGDGPLKQGLLALTKKYQLEKNVKFVAHLPYQDLHQELLKYHVFIHPSVTASDGDCEGGAPVVLLDAQGTGMPVIATYHCDIPEEVIDKKTGLLVSENDPIGLAESILYFLNNPDLLTGYGKAARKHVMENYSARKQAEKLESIYSSLLN